MKLIVALFRSLLGFALIGGGVWFSTYALVTVLWRALANGFLFLAAAAIVLLGIAMVVTGAMSIRKAALALLHSN